MLDFTRPIAARQSGQPGAMTSDASGLRSAMEPMPEERFAQMLDEIDYGMLLVAADAVIVYANHAARVCLGDAHPLQLRAGELRTRRLRDAPSLRNALAGAAQRGLRAFLSLGAEARPVCVAVVPVSVGDGAGRGAALVLLGKRRICEELSVEGYARCHGLTITETQVLKHLCSGARVCEIAARQQVALATVRSQIANIRAKTGTPSMRALGRLVAALPPLVKPSMCAYPRSSPGP